MRFIFRFISIICLIIAIIVGVVDALHSVVVGQLTLAPLGESWEGFNPESLELVTTLIQAYLLEEAWDPVAQWILLQPSSVVFLVLSFLFYALSYKREKPEDRFFTR
ncbi:hypothetical protein [Lentilitoribacter sp. Alg239-R112]|jgi:hypothetical protein|uniref:hypothetical protein n=1 Tax=Lentilitoribacter sp. Alg239-R112 TaxID=2305987 RepID=UPI0013A68BA9|nr:hypothetical protein [Lentilitoribacter sp. Alg239-R112]